MSNNDDDFRKNIMEDRFFTFKEGELKGWSTYHRKIAENHGTTTHNDPYEDLFGPFYFRLNEKGMVDCMFVPLKKHNNGAGFTHGGALMTFADFALFSHSKPERAGGLYVTLQFESQFISSSKQDIPIYSRAEVLRKTRDLVFVRGELVQNQRIILSYSGILKKVADV